MHDRLLNTLLTQHGAALRLFAAQWSHAPEDVLQEALVALAQLKHPPDRPLAWMYGTIRNKALGARRSDTRRRHRETAAVEFRSTWFESTAEDLLDANTCADAVAKLPEELRAIVVARIWGELTFEEIADACEISVSKAYRGFQRAIDELREQLEPTRETNSSKSALKTKESESV